MLGVDGWKSGWVAIVLEAGAFAGAATAADLPSLLQQFSSVAAVAIDMPIGFPISEPRRADRAARSFVGSRRSSVFPMLPKQVYETDTYAEASAVCNELWGKGLSKQSYALKTKIFEADGVVATDGRVFECHPEVTFAAMADAPLDWSKKTWNGQLLRRTLLADHGIVLPDDLSEAGGVPVDDVLDAAACAWSAERMRTGTSRTLPEDPAPGEPTIRF